MGIRPKFDPIAFEPKPTRADVEARLLVLEEARGEKYTFERLEKEYKYLLNRSSSPSESDWDKEYIRRTYCWIKIIYRGYGSIEHELLALELMEM